MSETFDSSLTTFDSTGAMADLCTFDSSLTTFDSSRTFDATTCQGGAAPAPAVTVRTGGWIQRRRYILPNDVMVWATRAEIQQILDEFVVVEQPKQKKKKGKRKAKHEPFVPIEIHFEPLPDFQVETLRPVLPKVMVWRPDLEALQRRLQQLKRRMDDEEAILLFL